jgi:hypothetical protein
VKIKAVFPETETGACVEELYKPHYNLAPAQDARNDLPGLILPPEKRAYPIRTIDKRILGLTFYLG